MTETSSPVSVQLLPCPFCGAPARTDLLPHAHGPGWVQCSECECDQHMSDTLEEAVTRWNTRAPARSSAASARNALRSFCKAGGELGCSCSDQNYQWFGQECKERMAGAYRRLLSDDPAQRPSEPLVCLRCGTVDAFGSVRKEPSSLSSTQSEGGK